MITAWLAAGMRRAEYELLSDDDGKPEGYFGKIPECGIVLASGVTLEACRTELQSCLEDWLLFRLTRSMPVPEFDGIHLAAAMDEEAREGRGQSMMEPAVDA